MFLTTTMIASSTFFTDEAPIFFRTIFGTFNDTINFRISMIVKSFNVLATVLGTNLLYICSNFLSPFFLLCITPASFNMESCNIFAFVSYRFALSCLACSSDDFVVSSSAVLVSVFVLSLLPAPLSALLPLFELW